MFTWCSLSTRVMSLSRPERSSASTWMCTRKTLLVVGAHDTSIMRSESPIRERTLVQSERWTETPLPRVTKPTISSPGTGVQHLASFTRMSGAPRTSTPESPPRGAFDRPTCGISIGPVEVSSCELTRAVTFSMTDWVEMCPSPTAA